MSAPNITNADLRACSPRESSMISVSPAAIPSGNGRFSSSMKCLRSGTASRHAQQSRRRQPDERLHPRQVDVETAAGFGGEDVECREQPAEKRNLPRRRAGRLNDVVLPAVVVLREQPERHEPEEGGDDRDVRAEAELEDHIRVRGADHQRDEQADDDRAWGDFADVGGLGLCRRRQRDFSPGSRVMGWPPPESMQETAVDGYYIPARVSRRSATDSRFGRRATLGLYRSSEAEHG